MKDTITQIQALLSQLQNEVSQVEQVSEFRALSGLELPDIICNVVDWLMPELKPYEVALYFHFLRHSIIANGAPYFRASRRGLQSGVFKSAREEKRNGNSGELGYAAVKEAVTGLEKVGAIRQEGEPTREGTLYRILLPEEVEVCQRRWAETKNLPVIPASEREADFYNVRENRLKIYERDNYHCTYCGKQLTRFTATLDHITPVSEGGDNSAENLKTSCLQCNSRKTARPLGDFLVASGSA
jgi:hypothetical protein